MPKETYVREIVDPDDDSLGTYHIRGVGNMQHTLCGYVDIAHVEHHYLDHPVNCTACIDMYKAIKGMRFPPGYFEDDK